LPINTKIGATLFLLFIVDLPHYSVESELQSFADDTRLWKHIRCNEDCVALQKDLNRVVEYFKRNRLQLNVNKTKSVIYHRGSLKHDFDYTIDSKKIERVKVIKDLGVILDEKLNFEAHIELITAKARSLLGWIKRFGREFEDPWTIKRLFFTFVIPVIEYASQIWTPHTAEKIARIESIQKQFLLYALRKLKWSDGFIRPKYEHRLLFFQMITLEERRKIAQIALVHNVIRGDVSSQYILDRIKIRDPRYRTRLNEFLSLPNRLRDYSRFEPINYMLITYNDFHKLKVPSPSNDPKCDKYLIDTAISTKTVKQRITGFLKSNRS